LASADRILFRDISRRAIESTFKTPVRLNPYLRRAEVCDRKSATKLLQAKTWTIPRLSASDLQRLDRRQLRHRSGLTKFSWKDRVRALASYGMTQAQVAELYGVSIDEIERIIRQSNSSRFA